MKKRAIRICLNMIVRDEQTNITDCLNSVRHLIDAIAIIDTGSTDRTVDVINRYAKKNKLPGKVITKPWKNFAENRTQALRHGEKFIAELDPHKKFNWYLMTMDADNRAAGYDGKKFQLQKEALHHDQYHVEMQTDGASYLNAWLFRYDPKKRWKWCEPVHEYSTPEGNWSATSSIAKGGVIKRYSKGLRSKNKYTYLEDAHILLKQIKDEPENSRAVFYAAQSLRDAGEAELAMSLYQRRSKMGGWVQEVYLSLLHMGYYRFAKGDHGLETINILLDAFEKCDTRLEAPFYLVRIWRLQGRFKSAWNFAKNLVDVAPPEDALFVNLDIHRWGFWEEAGLSAFYAGDTKNFRVLLNRVLKTKGLPREVRERTKNNLAEFG